MTQECPDMLPQKTQAILRKLYGGPPVLFVFLCFLTNTHIHETKVRLSQAGRCCQVPATEEHLGAACCSVPVAAPPAPGHFGWCIWEHWCQTVCFREGWLQEACRHPESLREHV